MEIKNHRRECIARSLESQSRIIRISRTGQNLLHELEGE
ncbi:hypothetical protein M059_03275 [Streptococcus mitis 18/56]|uniref:Uncharacterized protein n=1 Tax=Streptococcus mitis 18/56 TaxID=1340485 RepID=S7XME8_STRMT|nr:hypothetical protein M059_03275 [Streptococcus mitis 18/56]